MIAKKDAQGKMQEKQNLQKNTTSGEISDRTISQAEPHLLNLEQKIPAQTALHQRLVQFRNDLKQGVGVRASAQILRQMFEEYMLKAKLFQSQANSEPDDNVTAQIMAEVKALEGSEEYKRTAEAAHHRSANSKRRLALQSHGYKRSSLQWNFVDDILRPLERLSKLEYSFIQRQPDIQMLHSVPATQQIVASIDRKFSEVQQDGSIKESEYPFLHSSRDRLCRYWKGPVGQDFSEEGKESKSNSTRSSRTLLIQLRVFQEAIVERWTSQHNVASMFKCCRSLKAKVDVLVRRKFISPNMYCSWLRVLNLGNQAMHTVGQQVQGTVTQAYAETKRQVHAMWPDTLPDGLTLTQPANDRWGLHLLPSTLDDLLLILRLLVVVPKKPSP